MTTTNPSTEPSSPAREVVGGDGQGGLQAAIGTVAATGVLLALVTAFLWGGRMAFSVATGAAIATSNLYVLSRIVARLMSGATGTGALGVLAVTKIVVLVGGVWLLLTRGLVDPIALLVGYGSLPIGIALSTLLGDKKVARE
jgi:hypothetical protein